VKKKKDNNIKEKLQKKVEKRRKHKRVMKEEMKKTEVMGGRGNISKKRRENDCLLCRVVSSFVKIDQPNQTARGTHTHTHTQTVS
jgi:hypothetical protein